MINEIDELIETLEFLNEEKKMRLEELKQLNESVKHIIDKYKTINFNIDKQLKK
jgi:hypothetical protein